VGFFLGKVAVAVVRALVEEQVVGVAVPVVVFLERDRGDEVVVGVGGRGDPAEGVGLGGEAPAGVVAALVGGDVAGGAGDEAGPVEEVRLSRTAGGHREFDAGFGGPGGGGGGDGEAGPARRGVGGGSALGGGDERAGGVEPLDGHPSGRLGGGGRFHVGDGAVGLAGGDGGECAGRGGGAERRAGCGGGEREGGGTGERRQGGVRRGGGRSGDPVGGGAFVGFKVAGHQVGAGRGVGLGGGGQQTRRRVRLRGDGAVGVDGADCVADGVVGDLGDGPGGVDGGRLAVVGVVAVGGGPGRVTAGGVGVDDRDEVAVGVVGVGDPLGVRSAGHGVEHAGVGLGGDPAVGVVGVGGHLPDRGGGDPQVTLGVVLVGPPPARRHRFRQHEALGDGAAAVGRFRARRPRPRRRLAHPRGGPVGRCRLGGPLPRELGAVGVGRLVGGVGRPRRVPAARGPCPVRARLVGGVRRPELGDPRAGVAGGRPLEDVAEGVGGEGHRVAVGV